MKKVIATIRLGYNQVGFYDKLTGIYLTQEKPIAEIIAGMNTTQIRKSLASKRIVLISGSLDNSSLPIMTAVNNQKKTEAAPIANIAPNTEKPVMEQPIEKPAATVTEEVVSKKKSKRKAAEKAEEPVVEKISQATPVEEARPEVKEEVIVTIE